MINVTRSYWRKMPIWMKISAPLTVIMIAVGAVLISRGYDHGITLVGFPVMIIILRLWLHSTFEIGPQTILGYTYDYWTRQVEMAYSLPKGAVTIGLIVLFFIVVMIMSNFGA